MRASAVHRGVTSPLLALGLLLAGVPTALAQGAAPVSRAQEPTSPGTVQIATEPPRRQRRPLLDPSKRELRQARGLLAGGIVLTTLCAAGFGLATYTVVKAGERLQGSAGANTFTFGGAMLACTFMSIAGIGLGASRLRALRRSGRVAWTGGLGLRF